MIPEFAKYILAELEKHGFRAYLVGGCVRDKIMGRIPNDWDITTNALPEDIMRIFPKTVPTGIRFGTVTVICGEEKAEVTTFRSDGEYLNGRRPENVSFESDLSEDLKRRDFTVNALAMDRKGKITDLFGGVEDIEDKIIRCVGVPSERFNEDALRMFRAVRFSVTLGFEISENTKDAIIECAHLSSKLSGERVREEIEKILISETPERIEEVLNFGLFNSYIGTKTADVSFKELGCIPNDKKLRYAGFCGIIGFNGDEAREFLKKMRLDRNTVTDVSKGVILAEGFPSDRAQIKKLIGDNGMMPVLCAASICEARGKKILKDVYEIQKSGECLNIKDLAVTGEDIMELGITEGKEVGNILRKLFYAVCENPQLNEKEELLKEAKRLNR